MQEPAARPHRRRRRRRGLPSRPVTGAAAAAAVALAAAGLAGAGLAGAGLAGAGLAGAGLAGAGLAAAGLAGAGPAGTSAASPLRAAPVARYASLDQAAPPTWYAPYVDATLPPEYPSADPAVNPAGQTVFGFVVAAGSGSCTPSWGTYYSLSGIDGPPLQLGSVISTMQAEGETPIVSFGGEANQPLDDVCTSSSALAGAYQAVVDRYDLQVLDLDIEGAAQGDTAALALQAQAIRTVQASAAAAGRSLGVWLTLPVASTGMLPVAENVVDTMLDGGVALSGVNLMTMYLTPSPGDGAPMLAAVEQALEASHAQLGRIFASHGIHLSGAQVWSHMGATVQIGQAGIPDQAFTVADAQGLVDFAELQGLGRVSDWSANQDLPCGSASDPTVGGYSNFCSGVVQTPGQFGQIFGQLTGSATSTTLLTASTTSTATPPAPAIPSTAPSGPAPPAPAPAPAPAPGPGPGPGPVPVPAPTTGTGAGTGTGSAPPAAPQATTSYPAWSPTTPYPAGYEVARSGKLYRAKWWNQGIDPSQPVAAPWDTPWRLVRALPPGSQPWTPPTLPAGTYPAWSASRVYVAGDDVLYGGVPYQARWWNEGEPPASAASDPYGSPWRLLDQVPGEPARRGRRRAAGV